MRTKQTGLTLGDYFQIKYKKARIRAERFAFFKKVFLTVGVLAIAFHFCFGVAIVNSNINTPNVKDGDIVIYYKLQKDYVGEDFIYYEYNGKHYFGRIKATEGTEIDCTADGKLMINGNIQPIDREHDIYYEALVVDPDPYPFTIGHDEYFVLADLRGDSLDSRSFGALKKESIKGKAFFVLRKRNI